MKKTEVEAVASVPKRNMLVKSANQQQMGIKIRGTSPMVMGAMGPIAMGKLRDGLTKPKVGGKKPVRPPVDFNAEFNDCRHISRQGWDGIPCSSFRGGLIRACKLVEMQMTMAKISMFVCRDGIDRYSAQDLVQITKGTPTPFEAIVTLNDGSTTIKCRPMWEEGWESVVRVRWDADQFNDSDITNLMIRVGSQIGIMCGRSNSVDSPGMGWGEFEVTGVSDVKTIKCELVRK